MWKRRHRSKPIPPEILAHLRSPQGRAELEAYFGTEEGRADLARAFVREIAEKQPSLKEAFALDVATYASLMMKPIEMKTGIALIKEAVQLAWKSDAFFALLLYRVRVRLFVHEVPLLPSVLHRLSMMLAQIDIGENVVVAPGVYIPHGQVVIDGAVEIGTGSVIAPWATLGLNGKDLGGPILARGVFIGTGAKVLGPVQLGDFAKVGANAVVMSHVPAHATAVGIPAKIVRDPQKDARAAEEAAAATPAESNGAA